MPFNHPPLVSIVIPVLDEAGCVEEVARRARSAVTSADARCEILFVDDGSRDATPECIVALRAADPDVKLVRFTRTFGHQAALAAGLRFARGDAVVTMDGDLQHPPECIPRLIEAWRGGADVVQAVRSDKPGAKLTVKERVAGVFYRALSLLADVPIVAHGADFRLIDRRVVEAFQYLPEHHLFVRGLVPWMGFRQTCIEYEAAERFAGHSKYDLARQLGLGLDAIFSFSVAPLRAIALLGLCITLLGVAYGLVWLVAFFTGNVEGRGWTSLVMLILMFGGGQLLALGVVSEYVGRTYQEAKGRPRYVIDRVEGVDWP